MFRDLINDVDNRDFRYRMDKYDSLNDIVVGLLLDFYGELFIFGSLKLGSDVLRNFLLIEFV